MVLQACSNKPPSELRALECPEIKNLDTLLDKSDPEIIIIGEIHGQKEPPKLLEGLICHSLNSGKNTGLALEINDKDNANQIYWDSEGSNSDRNALMMSESWSSDFQDGRTSQAMFELIEYSRSLKQEGFPINIIWFRTVDINNSDFKTPSDYSQAFEIKMAKNIEDGKDKFDLDKTFALAGNFHARRGKASFGDLRYDLMATHLPGPQTISLNIVGKGGSSWNCLGMEPSDCKVSESGATISGISDPTPQIILNSNPLIEGANQRLYSKEWYDGVFYLEVSLASLPAKNKDSN